MNERNPSDRGQFAGLVPRRLSTAGVTLAEVVHARGRSLPGHGHADPYFCLLLSGRYEDIVSGRERMFAPADAMFSPPGLEHRDRIGTGGAKFFTISFDPAAGPAYVERPALWNTPQRWSASGPSLDLARLYVTFVQSGAMLEAIDVEARVLALWSAITGPGSVERGPAAWLSAARARLHDEIAPAPRIADLAVDAGVHPVYFSRAFTSRFGMGPAEYRARLRVGAACRALGQQLPIRRIAIALGFADQAHFTRDFRARIGVTPAAYRRIVSVRSPRLVLFNPQPD